MAKLSTLAIKRRLATLKGWKNTGNAIQKQFTFADFKGAMFFVNAVASLAEKAGHHPDITVTYNRPRASCRCRSRCTSGRTGSLRRANSGT